MGVHKEYSDTKTEFKILKGSTGIVSYSPEYGTN